MKKAALMNNSDKLHILVTGAASGIGAACARKLANPNNVLFLHTGKNQEKLDRLVQELRSQKGVEIYCYMYFTLFNSKINQREKKSWICNIAPDR